MNLLLLDFEFQTYCGSGKRRGTRKGRGVSKKGCALACIHTHTYTTFIM